MSSFGVELIRGDTLFGRTLVQSSPLAPVSLVQMDEPSEYSMSQQATQNGNTDGNPTAVQEASLTQEWTDSSSRSAHESGELASKSTGAVTAPSDLSLDAQNLLQLSLALSLTAPDAKQSQEEKSALSESKEDVTSNLAEFKDPTSLNKDHLMPTQPDKPSPVPARRTLSPQPEHRTSAQSSSQSSSQSHRALFAQPVDHQISPEHRASSQSEHRVSPQPDIHKSPRISPQPAPRVSPQPAQVSPQPAQVSPQPARVSPQPARVSQSARVSPQPDRSVSPLPERPSVSETKEEKIELRMSKTARTVHFSDEMKEGQVGSSSGRERLKRFSNPRIEVYKTALADPKTLESILADLDALASPDPHSGSELLDTMLPTNMSGLMPATEDLVRDYVHLVTNDLFFQHSYVLGESRILRFLTTAIFYAFEVSMKRKSDTFVRDVMASCQMWRKNFKRVPEVDRQASLANWSSPVSTRVPDGGYWGRCVSHAWDMIEHLDCLNVAIRDHPDGGTWGGQWLRCCHEALEVVWFGSLRHMYDKICDKDNYEGTFLPCFASLSVDSKTGEATHRAFAMTLTEKLDVRITVQRLNTSRLLWWDLLHRFEQHGQVPWKSELIGLCRFALDLGCRDDHLTSTTEIVQMASWEMPRVWEDAFRACWDERMRRFRLRPEDNHRHLVRVRYQNHDWPTEPNADRQDIELNDQAWKLIREADYRKLMTMWEQREELRQQLINLSYWISHGERSDKDTASNDSVEKKKPGRSKSFARMIDRRQMPLLADPLFDLFFDARRWSGEKLQQWSRAWPIPTGQSCSLEQACRNIHYPGPNLEDAQSAIPSVRRTHRIRLYEAQTQRSAVWTRWFGIGVDAVMVNPIRHSTRWSSTGHAPAPIPYLHSRSVLAARYDTIHWWPHPIWGGPETANLALSEGWTSQPLFVKQEQLGLDRWTEAMLMVPGIIHCRRELLAAPLMLPHLLLSMIRAENTPQSDSHSWTFLLSAYWYLVDAGRPLDQSLLSMCKSLIWRRLVGRDRTLYGVDGASFTRLFMGVVHSQCVPPIQPSSIVVSASCKFTEKPDEKTAADYAREKRLLRMPTSFTSIPDDVWTDESDIFSLAHAKMSEPTNKSQQNKESSSTKGKETEHLSKSEETEQHSKSDEKKIPAPQALSWANSEGLPQENPYYAEERHSSFAFGKATGEPRVLAAIDLLVWGVRAALMQVDHDSSWITLLRHAIDKKEMGLLISRYKERLSTCRIRLSDELEIEQTLRTLETAPVRKDKMGMVKRVLDTLISDKSSRQRAGDWLLRAISLIWLMNVDDTGGECKEEEAMRGSKEPIVRLTDPRFAITSNTKATYLLVAMLMYSAVFGRTARLAKRTDMDGKNMNCTDSYVSQSGHTVYMARPVATAHEVRSGQISGPLLAQTWIRLTQVRVAERILAVGQFELGSQIDRIDRMTSVEHWLSIYSIPIRLIESLNTMASNSTHLAVVHRVSADLIATSCGIPNGVIATDHTDRKEGKSDVDVEMTDVREKEAVEVKRTEPRLPTPPITSSTLPRTSMEESMEEESPPQHHSAATTEEDSRHRYTATEMGPPPPRKPKNTIPRITAPRGEIELRDPASLTPSVTKLGTHFKPPTPPPSTTETSDNSMLD